MPWHRKSDKYKKCFDKEKRPMSGRSEKELTGVTLLGAEKTKYPTDYDSSVLEYFINKHPQRDYFVKFNCPEFTSLCPMTGQPDFATIYISYVPDEKLVESKSLKLYLFSFRNHVAQTIDKLNQDYMALDIGPQTAKLFVEALKPMKTIVWNGPMGVFEMDAFCKGTEEVAKAVAMSKGMTIVGGGDSVAAIEKLKLAKKIKHISTGGGASLEYLEGKVLPGVAALDDLRRPLIAGNWKMHKTVAESVELATNVVEETFGTTYEVVVFPPLTSLETVADAIDGKEVGYGAQNMQLNTTLQ